MSPLRTDLDLSGSCGALAARVTWCARSAQARSARRARWTNESESSRRITLQPADWSRVLPRVLLRNGNAPTRDGGTAAALQRFGSARSLKPCDKLPRMPITVPKMLVRARERLITVRIMHYRLAYWTNAWRRWTFVATPRRHDENALTLSVCRSCLRIRVARTHTHPNKARVRVRH